MRSIFFHYNDAKANPKKLFVSYHPHRKKKSPRPPLILFFTWFKLNMTFYFKCYLHHNCSVNLNWNNTQLCNSAKPLRNDPSSVLWFVNFCFLPFLRRASVQKWKKNSFCYGHNWIGKKEISAKTTKYIASTKIPKHEGSISPFSFEGQPPDYWSHAFSLACPVD